MADPTIKQVMVTAEAASTIGGTRKRRRRTTAGETSKAPRVEKDGHKGGGSPGTLVQIEANKGPPSAVATAVVQRSEASELQKIPTNSTPAPIMGGAQAKVKVILEKSKKKTKVLLAPARVKKLPGAPATKPEKTRKMAKKVRMSLTGFGKRVGRAQTIRHEAKKETFEQVKKHLVDAKLIKPESKAPETVLRQMYADYMMLKNRAL